MQNLLVLAIVIVLSLAGVATYALLTGSRTRFVDAVLLKLVESLRGKTDSSSEPEVRCGFCGAAVRHAPHCANCGRPLSGESDDGSTVSDPTDFS